MGTQFGYSLTCFLLYIAGALFIFLKNTRDLKHIFLAFVALCLGFWQISLANFFIADTDFTAFILGKSTFLFGFMISFAFYLFSLVFPKQNNIWENSKLRWVSIVPALVVCFLIIVSDLIVTDINYKAETLGKKAVPGKAFFLAGVLFIIYISSGVYFLNMRLKKAFGREKMQILFLNLSIAIWALCFCIFTVVLPIFGNTQFVWLAPMVSFVFILGIAYALLKYRLFDIQLVIKRTSIYVVLVAFISGLYAFVMMVPYSLVGKPGSMSSILILVIATLIITMTIQPLRNWLDEITDKFFYQKKYDYQKMLEKVAKQLNAVVKLDEAVNVVVDPFINDMHLKGVGIYMREKAGDDAYICHKKVGEIAIDLPDAVTDTNPLIVYLGQEMKIVEPGEFRYQYGHLYSAGNIKDAEKAAIQTEMDDTFNAGLFIPLMLKNTLIGLIVLGEKKSGDQFTFRDLSLLETVASQLVTSMDNIRLYEQMLNNERLTIIGTMSASIAHEIRNPLASIKAFIQMLPDKVAKPEFIKRFNEIVPAEIERISGITSDLLTFSKPSSPTLEPVDTKHLLERVIILLAAQFRKRQIEVVRELLDLPAIQADSQQLFQVFLNMFLNSIQASELGRMIKVSSRMKEDGQSIHKFHESVVYITIEDQGAGIKRKDMINIFQPFFTTKSEGTGLGLATCKRIIDAHRGDIFVESELGVGTKMTVMLPMKLTPEVVLSEAVLKN